MKRQGFDDLMNPSPFRRSHSNVARPPNTRVPRPTIINGVKIQSSAYQKRDYGHSEESTDLLANRQNPVQGSPKSKGKGAIRFNFQTVPQSHEHIVPPRPPIPLRPPTQSQYRSRSNSPRFDHFNERGRKFDDRSNQPKRDSFLSHRAPYDRTRSSSPSPPRTRPRHRSPPRPALLERLDRDQRPRDSPPSRSRYHGGYF